MSGWLIGLLQSIFARFIWELLLATGVGGFIAGLKARKETWAGPVLYGLTAFALIFVIGFVLTGQAPLRGQSEEVNAENVEENLKVWADHLAMSLERQPPAEANFFSYLARVHSGDPIYVSRAKEKPGYIQLKATINLSPEHQALLVKLSKPESTKLINELGLEMTKLKMTAALDIAANGKGDPIQLGAVLQKAVPIPDLNEGSFASNFDDVVAAIAQIRAATNLWLGTQPYQTKQLGFQ
jgi:hypothetical protein